MNDAKLATELAKVLSGRDLITLEMLGDRLYVHAGDTRMHRSKVMAWWRRNWIELQHEQVVNSGRKRTWQLTSYGLDAVKGAES